MQHLLTHIGGLRKQGRVQIDALKKSTRLQTGVTTHGISVPIKRHHSPDPCNIKIIRYHIPTLSATLQGVPKVTSVFGDPSKRSVVLRAYLELGYLYTCTRAIYVFQVQSDIVSEIKIQNESNQYSGIWSYPHHTIGGIGVSL